jgi:hypothetical protein
MSSSYIEMTVRIDADAHPRLHVYLLAREAGKRRAAALKRLAEDALLLGDSAPAVATHRVDHSGSAVADAAAAPPSVTQAVTPGEVLSSLAQFMPGSKP